MKTYLDLAKERRPDKCRGKTDEEIIAIYCPKDLRLEKAWPDCLTRKGGYKMECRDCWLRPAKR